MNSENNMPPISPDSEGSQNPPNAQPHHAGMARRVDGRRVANLLRRQNIEGQTFGRLTAIKRASDRPSFIECRCSCGCIVTVKLAKLNNGHTQSCGCLQKERTSAAVRTHGRSGYNGKAESTYAIWKAMIQRCTNPSNKSYPDYGGRGISVCERWVRSFEAFHEDMGDRPEGLSLDRRDNNLGYSKDNCRWATKVTQANNTRSNRFIEHNGERRTIAQWGRITGLGSAVILTRLFRGASDEEAIKS